MAENCCGTGTRLLYACSGASDVGEIADRVARRLWAEGFARKTCLAGVGADMEGFVQSAKGADANITLDGCPLACAKKCLERIGVTPESYIFAEFGLEKGKTPVTGETVNRIVARVKEKSPLSVGAAQSDSACC